MYSLSIHNDLLFSTLPVRNINSSSIVETVMQKPRRKRHAKSTDAKTLLMICPASAVACRSRCGGTKCVLLQGGTGLRVAWKGQTDAGQARPSPKLLSSWRPSPDPALSTLMSFLFCRECRGSRLTGRVQSDLILTLLAARMSWCPPRRGPIVTSYLQGCGFFGWPVGAKAYSFVFLKVALWIKGNAGNARTCSPLCPFGHSD